MSHVIGVKVILYFLTFILALILGYFVTSSWNTHQENIKLRVENEYLREKNAIYEQEHIKFFNKYNNVFI